MAEQYVARSRRLSEPDGFTRRGAIHLTVGVLYPPPHRGSAPTNVDDGSTTALRRNPRVWGEDARDDRRRSSSCPAASQRQSGLGTTITGELAVALVGDAGEALLENAAIHGFLTPSPRGRPEFHPLLRQFLRSKLDLTNPKTLERVDSLVSYLVSTGAWDDAFTVIELADPIELLSSLLDAALDEVLRRGRVATVRRWLAAAKARGVISPQIDLARAEVSFREGRHTEAEMQARDAARGLPSDHALHSRALYRAAQSAQLADRAGDALRLTKRPLARQRRRSISDKRSGDSSLPTPNLGNGMRHSQRLCCSNVLNRRLRRTSCAKLKHT